MEGNEEILTRLMGDDTFRALAEGVYRRGCIGGIRGEGVYEESDELNDFHNLTRSLLDEGGVSGMNAILNVIQKKVDELTNGAEDLRSELLSFGWPDDRPTETESTTMMEENLNWYQEVKTPARKEIPKRFIHNYHHWYAAGLALIEANMPSRRQEFVILHEGEKRVKGTVGNCVIGLLADDRMSFSDQIAISHIITHMSGILGSIPQFLISRLHNLELAIAQSYINDELVESGSLLRNGHIRTAGAIAGVLLERHLKMLCDRQHPPIKYTKTAGISKLNDMLKDVGLYDTPQWRRVQWMGDVRNQCDHANKTDPRPEDVRDQIEEVKKFVALFVI